jgi:predicted Holliday junction resolvase-like endonuclease
MDFWLAALLADIAITLIVVWWGWSQKRQALRETERATELKQEVHEAELKIVELEMSATSDTVEAAMESLMEEAALQKQMIHDLRTDNGILSEELNRMTAEMRKQKGRAASAHTQRGQLLEKWTPFLNHPDIDEEWDHKDWSFLGQPIDYVVFNWYENKQENLERGQIVMLDVKSGKSSLTTKQRRIRDLVQAGRVEWREIRLD